MRQHGNGRKFRKNKSDVTAVFKKKLHAGHCTEDFVLKVFVKAVIEENLLA